MSTLDIKRRSHQDVMRSLTIVMKIPTPKLYANFLSNLETFVKQLQLNEIKKRQEIVCKMASIVDTIANNLGKTYSEKLVINRKVKTVLPAYKSNENDTIYYGFVYGVLLQYDQMYGINKEVLNDIARNLKQFCDLNIYIKGGAGKGNRSSNNNKSFLKIMATALLLTAAAAAPEGVGDLPSQALNRLNADEDAKISFGASVASGCMLLDTVGTYVPSLASPGIGEALFGCRGGIASSIPSLMKLYSNTIEYPAIEEQMRRILEMKDSNDAMKVFENRIINSQDAISRVDLHVYLLDELL